MSNDECTIVSVTYEPVESSGDKINNSDRVLLSLDMPLEPFSGSASDSGRTTVNEPDTGRRPSSGQANQNPEIGSSAGTVPEVGELPLTSVCAHCRGTGKSEPLRVVLDRNVVMAPIISTAPVMSTVPVISTASTVSTAPAQSTAPTKSTVPTNSTGLVRDAESAKLAVVSVRPNNRVRSRSRIHKKKRTGTKEGRSNGSGDTCDVATPKPLLRPKVRAQRRTTVGLTTSTDSTNEESVSGHGNGYSSGDRLRSVRFDKKTIAKAITKAALAFRTADNARPPSRKNRHGRQNSRKRRHSSSTSYDR